MKVDGNQTYICIVCGALMMVVVMVKVGLVWSFQSSLNKCHV